MMKVYKQMNADITLKDVNSFQQIGLNSFIVQCLSKCNFIRPTPIQYYSVTSFINYPLKNIIAQSKSGTGKTLSFLTPILNDLCIGNFSSKSTVCLIILPTRQLSVQVHQYLKKILNAANEIKPLPNEKGAKNVLKSISSLLSIGGIPIQDDKKTLLTSGANFVIGTVGRIYQLIQCGYLSTDGVKFVIFDQGDKLFQNKDQKLDKILLNIRKSYLKNQIIIKNESISTIQPYNQYINQQQNFNERSIQHSNQQNIKTNHLNKIQSQKSLLIRFLVYSATYTEQSIKKIRQKLLNITELSQKIKQQNRQIKQKFIYIQTLTIPNISEPAHIVALNLSQLNLNKSNILESWQSQTNSKGNQYSSKNQLLNQNDQLLNLQNIKKYWIQIDQNQKSMLVKKCDKLKMILQELNYKKCLIFVEKKALLEQIYDQIQQFQPLLIHGSLSQSSRIKVMNQANKAKIIISSDLLARGIDLVLDLVILYDANLNQTFWHRIGRTGRFGRTGVAISLDKIQTWSDYNATQINTILTQICLEEHKLNKNQWYGTYMTQYGRWQEVDRDKQQILNKSYKFFQEDKIGISQNIQHPRGKEDGKVQNNSKKNKKQQKNKQKHMKKQIQLNEHTYIQQKQRKQNQNNIKQSYNSQVQFIQQHTALFKCQNCLNMINEIQQMTNYYFALKKYFIN